jgi:uncharacterized membrane protein
MNTSDENEIKKEFQLERIIFFSDAVFAIIITIMVLDVKLPEVTKAGSETEVKNSFLQILPKLTAYIISFFAVGSLWMRHLRIFSFLRDYNLQLVTINLIFLFSVSLFPFALSFVFSNAHIMQYTWGIYTYLSIIYFTTFAQSLLIGYLIKNKEYLCFNADKIETVLKWKTTRINYYAIPVIFLMLACTIYFDWNNRIFFGVVIAFAALMRILRVVDYRRSGSDKVTLTSLFTRIKQPPAAVKKIRKKPA